MITLTKIETNFMRPRESRPYPPDNSPPFEEWFLDNYNQSRNKSDRILLPILTTELNKQYLRNKRLRRDVDNYFRELDKSKKYFLIVQHDDGVLFNLHGADVKIFGMGCKGDVQLPLVCQPHKYKFMETDRPIFASFIGSITHPIRQKLVDELKDRHGYLISTEATSLHLYCWILSKSKFVLCPRGYGKTSFRIQEALQYGAIPIYLSDEFLYSIGCIKAVSIEGIIAFLNAARETIEEDHYLNQQTFNQHYTYEAVSNMIYENL